METSTIIKVIIVIAALALGVFAATKYIQEQPAKTTTPLPAVTQPASPQQ